MKRMRSFDRLLEDRNSWDRISFWIIQRGWCKKSSSFAYGCSSLRVFFWWLILVKSLGRIAAIAPDCQSVAEYCYRLLQAFRMFWQVRFCRVLLHESGEIFRCYAKSSHWTIVDIINFRVFIGDEYLNLPMTLWKCVTSCKTLHSEEALKSEGWLIVALFAVVKKERWDSGEEERSGGWLIVASAVALVVL